MKQFFSRIFKDVGTLRLDENTHHNNPPPLVGTYWVTTGFLDCPSLDSREFEDPHQFCTSMQMFLFLLLGEIGILLHFFDPSIYFT